VNYRPTGDSPFDCAYRDWLGHGHIGHIPAYMLDELTSCADAKLSCAAYADDSDLRDFRDSLDARIFDICR
jgi:hypothetical protein